MLSQHIDFAVALQRISIVTALRSLRECEGDFEIDEADYKLVAGASEDEPDLRGIFFGEDRQLILTGRIHGDDIVLTMPDDATVPADAAQAFAWLGLGAPKARRELRLSEEAFVDRLDAMDAAWSLVKCLINAGVVPEIYTSLAARLFGLSAQWMDARMRLFNATSEAVEDRAEAQLDSLENELRSIQIEGKSVSIRAFRDPRGSTFILCVDGREIGVCAVSFNWQSGTVALLNEAPAKRQASRKKGQSADRFGVRPTKVPDEVMEILSGLAGDDREVRITQQLTPRLYKRVNQFLEALGGQWNKSAQCHLFDEPAKFLIAQALATGEVFTYRDFEFFETQPRELARMIELANLVPGDKVLEPEAGSGVIAQAAGAVVGLENVRCYELMPSNHADLKSRGFCVGAAPEDFLAANPEPVFNAVIMNPPFSGGRDMAHIIHAMKFLRPGGRLVALSSTQWRDRPSKAGQEFSKLLTTLGARIEDIPAGAFKAVGTNVPTLLISASTPLVRPSDKDALPFSQREAPPQMARPVAASLQESLF